MSLRKSALRTLQSAALAAAVLAADGVVLTLLLNPGLELRAEAPALFLALFLPWSLAATALLLTCALLFSLFRWWPSSAQGPIPSLPWLTTLMLLAVATAAGLFAHNFAAYGAAIPAAHAEALERSTGVLIGASLVLLGIGLDALWLPARRRGGSAALVVLVPAAAVVVPLVLFPETRIAAEPILLATEAALPERRVVIIGLDGLAPRMLEAGMRDDSLPALSRLAHRGSWGSLATLRPTEGPPLWASIFTGRLPRDHGVKSFDTYRLLGSTTVYELLPKRALVSQLERIDLVTPLPSSAARRRVPALWNALGGFGIRSGLVGLWGSHPSERVSGFMLSNYFHVLRDRPERLAATLHPPDLMAEARARAVDPEDVDETLLSEFLEPSGPEPDAAAAHLEGLVRSALAADLTYARAGEMLRAAYDPDLYALYFFGLDAMSHAFLRHAEPERFGDVGSEEVRRYGRALSSYVAFLGREVARYERALGPKDVLFVVSAYGIEPVPLWRRLLGAMSGRASSASHASAPDGVILAVGSGIRVGGRVQGATLLDLAPTVLYLMGLPVARDMEGRVLTELLDEELVRSHPVTFIPSYASLAVTPPAPAFDAELPPLPDDEG